MRLDVRFDPLVRRIGRICGQDGAKASPAGRQHRWNCKYLYHRDCTCGLDQALNRECADKQCSDMAKYEGKDGGCTPESPCWAKPK